MSCGPSGPEHVASEDRADEWRFVEALRTLRATQHPQVWIVARDSRGPVLWLQADGATYVAEPSTVQAIRRGAIQLSELTLHDDSQPLGDPSPRPGAELYWFAGYHASDLPAPWLDSAARYRITRWPNFGWIRPLPSHIRVAAALAAAAADLRQIAFRAHVSMEEATRTLNALATCDIVAVVDSGLEIAPQPRQITAQPRGGFTAFLRNVRKHLGLST
jgi:hypothetical protein